MGASGGRNRGPDSSTRARPVTKAATGITGLDIATRGGLPRGRTTMVFGGPGCGKTILALQTLVNGARAYDESGVFVAFEEPPAQIIGNAASFGWNLPELQRRKLFFFDAQLRPDVVSAGAFDLSAILATLSLKVRELDAKRIVFDGIDVLLTLLDDPAAERTELLRVHDWVKRHNLTCVLTAKADGDQPFSAAPYAFAAYLADCALHLSRSHAGAVSERDLAVLKYRGSAFSENRVPMVIGDEGIEVAEDNAHLAPTSASIEHLSTGVTRLDTMLRGGYLRGSSGLITGLPGTAKSTLCGAFLEAACRHGERGLYVSFDEPAAERVRNLLSVSIDLRPHIKSNHLRIIAAPPLSDSAEIQLMRIRAAIRQQRATCVVIDHISALGASSDPTTARGVLARFVFWAKVHGITLLNACQVSGSDPASETTALGASTLCDSWIHLAYAQAAGERNRSITIIKARGTAHSNQLRELLLSDEGVDLADVYQTGGEVLMGTLRWEKENSLRDQERRLRQQARSTRVTIEHEQAELRAKLETVRRALAVKSAELQLARDTESERVDLGTRRHRTLMQHRRADGDATSTKTYQDAPPAPRVAARPRPSRGAPQ